MIVLNKPIGKNSERINLCSPTLEPLISMTLLGRNAVKEFLVLNDLSRCKMLLPAYICGSFVNYLKQIGIEIHYYNVSSLQVIDLADLKQKISECNPSVVMLIHFFGLKTKNIAEARNLLGSLGLLTLEDYCHSFGALWADVKSKVGPEHAIVSYRKTLPLRFGGGYYKASKNGQSHHIFHSKEKCKKVNLTGLYLAERTAKFFSWPNIYAQRFERCKAYIRSLSNNNTVTANVPVKFDMNSLKFISDNYLLESNQKRIDNYHYLFSLIRDVSELNVAMSFGVPQAFIIRDQTHLLCDYLNKRGIGAYKWPGDDVADEKYIHEEFPDVIRLCREVTCVPIHQELLDHEISYMADEINKYYGKI